MGLFDLELQQQTATRSPRSAVWEVFADIERWPEWNSVCEKVRIIEGTPWTPGFRFHMVLRMAGRAVPFEPVVVHAEPERVVTWTSTRFTVTGTRTFTLDSGDGSTLISDTKRFSSPVLPVRLFYPRPVINRMSEAWLASLAREATRRAEA